MRATLIVLGWLTTQTLVGACAPRGRVPAHVAAQGAREMDADAPGSNSTSPGQTFSGKASYYSDALAGRSTANGEPYDPRKLTAASRTLPFGTRLRVTRVDNQRSVEVRVNDRGPFGKRERILDLSRAAAEALDMIRAGVVDVRVEVLESPASRQ